MEEAVVITESRCEGNSSAKIYCPVLMFALKEKNIKP